MTIRRRIWSSSDDTLLGSWHPSPQLCCCANTLTAARSPPSYPIMSPVIPGWPQQRRQRARTLVDATKAAAAHQLFEVQAAHLGAPLLQGLLQEVQRGVTPAQAAAAAAVAGQRAQAVPGRLQRSTSFVIACIVVLKAKHTQFSSCYSADRPLTPEAQRTVPREYATEGTLNMALRLPAG